MCWLHYFTNVTVKSFYPCKENDKKKLLQKQGGASLVDLAKKASQECPDLIPLLLFDDVQEGALPSSLAQSIAMSVGNIFNGSDSMKEWLAEEITQFGTYGADEIKEMWRLIGSYLDPLMIHAFVNFSSFPCSDEMTKYRRPDAIGIILIRLLSVFGHFFNGNDADIRKQIENLKKMDLDPKKDEQLLKIFTPLALELLHLMGLDDPEKIPVPQMFKEVIAEQLRDLLPGIILSQYCTMLQSEFDDQPIRKTLRTLLFDPKGLFNPEIAVKVVSQTHQYQPVKSLLKKEGDYEWDPEATSEPALKTFDQFYQSLWTESGTEKMAKAVETMCSEIAENVVQVVLKHYGIAAQSLLKSENNPFMAKIKNGLKKDLETALLETLVHVIHSIENKEVNEQNGHPKSLVLINACLQLNTLIEQRLLVINQEMEKIAKIHPEGSEHYQQEILKLFEGMAADLHSFIAINPFKHFPLDECLGGDTAKDKLWGIVKTSLFPVVLQQIHQDLTKWQKDLHKTYEELEKNYRTSHPKWACKVLGQYSTDFIQHYLTHSSGEAASLTFEGIIAYFEGVIRDGFQSRIEQQEFLEEEKKEESKEKNSADGSSAARQLKELKEKAEFFIGQNMRQAALTDDPHFNTLWPKLAEYCEAIYATIFSGMSTTLHDIDTTHPDFAVDAATRILKEIASHYSIQTRVTEEHGFEKAFEVPITEMLVAFGDRLHDGVPLNPSDPQDVQDQVRLKGFFIPLAAKLLKLANITVKDLPIPPAGEPIGELILHKIFPVVLMNVCRKAIEPRIRNGFMLNFIQTLYAALNEIKPIKAASDIEEAAIQPDPKQKYLYETCGNLVLELIKLIPDTALQYVFMKEKVKNMSAEAIGDALMPYLSRLSLLHLIDVMIYEGLPKFHPAKWEGKQGREELVPRKAFVRPDGKMELRPCKEFKFHFSATADEIRQQAEQDLHEAAQVRKELRDAFTKTISQQLYEKTWAFLRSLWDYFQLHLNDFIERTFPEKGPETKQYLDQVFRKAAYAPGIVLGFLMSPVMTFLKFVAEKTVVDRRSEDIIENLESEVLETLFYTTIDVVVDALLKCKMELKPQE